MTHCHTKYILDTIPTLSAPELLETPAMRNCLIRTALTVALVAGVVPAAAEPVEALEQIPVEIRPRVGCEVLFPAFVDRATWDAQLWPDGLVPYEFDANTTGSMQTAMRAAMDVLESVCNVVFLPRTTEGNYLRIRNWSGNSSFVGMVGGGQTVNIFNWNYTFIMAHELMHALGVWHEQSRPDRDAYVIIDYSKIQPGAEHNFDIQADASTVGPYDFESIMHYDACGFSICCPAGSSCNCAVSCAPIQAKPAYASFQNIMGSRSRLSDGDIEGLQAKYGPVGSEPGDAIAFSPWPFPNDLVTVPSPAAIVDKLKFGDTPSFGFMLTTRTGYHRLDGAPLNDLVPGPQLPSEYARFVNALFANPGAIRNIAIADAETLDSGNGVTPDTLWLPSATPKKLRVAPIPEAP